VLLIFFLPCFTLYDYIYNIPICIFTWYSKPTQPNQSDKAVVFSIGIKIILFALTLFVSNSIIIIFLIGLFMFYKILNIFMRCLLYEYRYSWRLLWLRSRHWKDMIHMCRPSPIWVDKHSLCFLYIHRYPGWCFIIFFVALSFMFAEKWWCKRFDKNSKTINFHLSLHGYYCTVNTHLSRNSSQLLLLSISSEITIFFVVVFPRNCIMINCAGHLRPTLSLVLCE